MLSFQKDRRVCKIVDTIPFHLLEIVRDRTMATDSVSYCYGRNYRGSSQDSVALH